MSDSDEPCHEYCCSRLASVEEQYLSDSENGDGLTCEIHPILAETSFSNAYNYSMIKPSLRLLTKFLHSDAVAMWLTTMVDGRVEDVSRKEIDPVEFCERPKTPASHASESYAFVKPRLKEVTAETRARAGEILAHLVGHVTFDLVIHCDDARMGPPGKQTGGRCVRGDSPLPDHLPEVFKYGDTSKIVLGPYSSYNDVIVLTEQHIQQGSGFDKREKLLIARFDLARILLHEIAHSVEIATFNGMRGSEIFYDDSLLNEIGYTLEQLVFGGLICGVSRGQFWYPDNFLQCCRDPKNRPPLPILLMMPWPSYDIWKRYRDDDLMMEGDGGALDRHQQVKRVPLSYLVSLFSEEFWNTTIKGKGQSALHPKSLGEWTFQSAGERHSLWPFDTPAPQLPCAFGEMVARVGFERAHDLCDCSSTSCARTARDADVGMLTSATEDLHVSSGGDEIVLREEAW